MNIVMDYIVNNYELGEPIFITDISIDNVSNDNLKQHFKRLVDANQIQRFEKGIYYLPRESQLKSGFHLSADIVAKYKYISRNGKIMGYYSGYTFANQLGICTQVPAKVEIVSNESAPIVRDVTLGNHTFTIRKPRVQVDSDNCRILQLLDLLKDLEEYSDTSLDEVRERLLQYVKSSNITKKDIDQYIEKFPVKIYKTIYDMRLEHVLA